MPRQYSIKSSLTVFILCNVLWLHEAPFNRQRPYSIGSHINPKAVLTSWRKVIMKPARYVHWPRRSLGCPSDCVYGRTFTLTYAADHGKGNKAVLTNVSGHSGDELHCPSRPVFTDHRPKSNEFFFPPAVFVSVVGSVNILSCTYCVLWTFCRARIVFCEHFVVHVLCSPRRMVHLEKLISWVSEKKPLWDTKDKLHHNTDIVKTAVEWSSHRYGM